MPAGTELAGPVEYASTWSLLALALAALVVGYYLWAALSGPPAEESVRRESGAGVDGVRTQHLKEIDRIATMVTAGRVPLRVGFQQLSAAVRSFVDDASDVPARSMTLEDLRASADPKVADAIEAMYPPEFAPADAEPEDFQRVLGQARELVRSWT